MDTRTYIALDTEYEPGSVYLSTMNAAGDVTTGQELGRIELDATGVTEERLVAARALVPEEWSTVGDWDVTTDAYVIEVVKG